MSWILFAAAAGAGLFLLALGLPGNWLLLAGLLLAAAVSPKAAVTLGAAVVLLSLCLLAELAEWFCGVLGAKRLGVSTAGLWGAVLGGLAGALLGGALLPIVGAVPGGLLGTFLGAFGLELARGEGRREAMRLGYRAFAARILALIAKTGVTLAMVGVGFFWLL
ncbi:MAG: DUF456 family protein [Elusimicrobia bacterium]|nr:DUF456 family protein [Elusimicrobiota bacterium]